MQWLKDFFKRLNTTWTNMTNGKKLALISVGVAFIVSLTVYYFLFGKVTYVPLFNDLTVMDSGKIVQRLDEMGVTDYKLEAGGTTISVPENDVDRLRINLANEGALPSNGAGFELFDEAGFALTSEERKIMYQRALQGELQRAIMALEEVDFATVILSMPQESLFANENKAGSASVLLRLNAFKKLEPQKVRGIVALVSGAVKGIPPENVQVIDTELNYLSFGLSEKEDYTSVQETGNRITLKKNFENTLADDLQQMLETALGRGKVVVKVNAEMNFDTEERTSITYDPNPVIRSIQESINIESSAGQDLSLSPVDNNLQYYGENTDAISETEGLASYENTRNYEIGETQVHTIKAPGEIIRLTTSVIYDGELSDARKTAIKNIVLAAVGFNENRGDIISIEGLTFDRTSEQEIKQAMEAAEEEYNKEVRRQTIIKYVRMGAGAFILFIFFIVILVKMRKSGKVSSVSETMPLQPMPIEEMIQDVSVRLNVVDNNNSPEREIKEYANEAPDKVADIVRTWILKDEG
ncbi:MAG: flagellar M-ring protein FliF [Clostridiaceae bacterium]|nr:flagellar M-ring protein FliF [Clostridiaceae bacterium]